MASVHHGHLTSLWWPEERIKATLDTKYIVNRLRPASVPRLFDLPKWGEGLTSETYMEYILLKAGRLFLILNEIGIPDRIFALVDESCEDEDLPIAEQNVDRLYLSPDGNDPALDSKFFLAQWHFCVRGITEGDHVKYTSNEGVPVQVLRQTAITNDLQGRDDTVDKVVLAGAVSKVFMRTQIQVGGAPQFSADEIVAEIKALRNLAHKHVLSIYASYHIDDTICVLFTCAETERTLHSFLTDEPPSFKRLSKEHRRATLITWPHCLVSALAWLHAQGHFHGAIRPSNILIDSDFNIALGQFHVLDSMLSPPRVHDLESYQYSAPERWVRTSAPVHPTPPTSGQNLLLPSGGRTGRRRPPPSRLTLSPLTESPPSSPDLPRPDSAASKGTVIRIGLPGSPSRFSFAFSTSSSSSASTISSTNTESTDQTLSPKPAKRNWLRSKPSLTRLKPSPGPTPSIITSPPPPSITSSSSSNSSTPSTPSSPLNPLKASTAHADLFSLAAITLDILTHLCKRTQHAFTSHRSARNRSAGRGGGMADASFHLARNAVQVQSWIALLEGDALKRCRRDRGSDRVFWAVPKMLIVLRAMLSAEPAKRPSAKRVRRCFEGAIGGVPGGGGVHCVRKENKEKEKEREKEKEKEKEKARMDVRERSIAREVKPKVEVAESVIDSSSVSDFDFGFSDGGSDSETVGHLDDDGEIESLFEEEEIVVDRVSPQLSLPDLDLHLTGIEDLALHE